MADKENKNNGNQDINADTNENQEHNLDELLGDDLDESEQIAEMLRNSETLSSGKKNAEDASPPDEPDLSELLDDPDKDAGSDPSLDEALSEFIDDGADGGESGEEDELKKKLEEEKFSKIKKIKRVSLIGALTVFVLAVGILVFFMIENNRTSIVLTYEREIDGRVQTQRVTADEFKILMLNDQSFSPIAGAMDYLMFILTIEKAADERNIILSAEEAEQIRTTAVSMKESIEEEFPELKNITLEFLEKVYGLNILYFNLLDSIFEQVEAAALDEEDYAVRLNDFIENSQTEYIDAMFKYMILPEETANEAKAAIESGEMTVEEALIHFYYNTDDFAMGYGFESAADLLEAGGHETFEDFIEEYGYDMVHLNNLGGFNHDDIKHLVSLDVNQVSNVIELDAESFVLFIVENINIPAHEEIEGIFREIYTEMQAQDIFYAEYDRLHDEIESSVKINERALDNIDLEELFGYW